jgi:hypothetical protein
MTEATARIVRCSTFAALAVVALGLDARGSSLEAQTPPAAAPTPPAEPSLQWHDITQWGVEGRAWPDLARSRWFDRFPLSG